MVSTTTDTNTTTEDRADTESSRPPASLIERVQRHVTDTVDWAQRQQPRHLVTLGAFGLVAGVVAWTVLKVLFTVLAWIFHAMFGDDAPAAPPAPDAPNQSWVSALKGITVWDRSSTALTDFATGHAPAVGAPALFLLVGWLAVGVVLLLAYWDSHRTLTGALALGWVAATSAAIWLQTGNAALAGFVGVVGAVIVATPWTLLAVSILLALTYLA